MKIFYIQNARIPTEKAHGIQIMKMCEVFASQGAEVELVLPKRLNPIKTDPFEYYGTKRNFRIKKLPCLDLIPFFGHFGLWIESLTFLISTSFYILFKKADAFYTKKSMMLPVDFFKKNVFFEVHIFTRNYSLYSPVFKRLKGIIAITQHLKNNFLEKGIPEEKIMVAPDGVDLEKFDISESKEDCRKKLNLPLDKKIALYTGHLYGWKGADVFAASAKHFNENTLLVFVGGTEEDIKSFKAKNSDPRIKTVGHKPHKEIPFWLKAADVLVLPNSGKEKISVYWTSPLKLFEYMASKRPIVASGLPSIREILNENNAVLVRPDDPENLAQGINKVFEDKELAEKLAEQAFSEVENYTWDKRAKNILEFIKNAK